MLAVKTDINPIITVAPPHVLRPPTPYKPPYHRAKLYAYSSSIFCEIHSSTELPPVSLTHPNHRTQETYLSITPAFANTFANPIPSVGHGTPGTIYFITKTATPPAIPPARKAKPRNRTTRAFHATPDPEYEKESAERRDFSIELMISIPSVEKMKGSQSMKVMWVWRDPLRGDLE